MTAPRATRVTDWGRSGGTRYGSASPTPLHADGRVNNATSDASKLASPSLIGKTAKQLRRHDDDNIDKQQRAAFAKNESSGT